VYFFPKKIICDYLISKGSSNNNTFWFFEARTGKALLFVVGPHFRFFNLCVGSYKGNHGSIIVQKQLCCSCFNSSGRKQIKLTYIIPPHVCEIAIRRRSKSWERWIYYRIRLTGTRNIIRAPTTCFLAPKYIAFLCWRKRKLMFGAVCFFHIPLSPTMEGCWLSLCAHLLKTNYRPQYRYFVHKERKEN